MQQADTREELCTFPIDQFFYSRTDKRGVLQSGNTLFAQISGYGGDELIGAPHKIVRHPDMPRALFATMWQQIEGDRPLSAYVKNRARDGRAYWVFASTVPIADGYISVRMAPRTRHFDEARAIYAQLRAQQAPRSEPQAERERLLDALVQAGYRSYEDFMATATEAELAARPDGAPLIAEFAHLSAMRQRLEQLASTQDELLETFSTLYLVPTNMRILASRLEPAGGPVSAIADSYKRTAAELMTRLRGSAGRQAGAARELLGQMDEVVYYSAVAHILGIAAPALANDPGFGAADRGTDIHDIPSRAARMIETNHTQVETVLHQIRRLQREAEAIQRLMSGLEQVRILGEVESGRLRHNDGGLAAIMGQLHDFHNRIRNRLNTMIGLSVEMSAATE